MAMVYVKDNNIEFAIKKLKKQVATEGIFRDFKFHNFYEKPSEKKVRKTKEAKRRHAKALRKKRERENSVHTSHYRRPEARGL